MPKITKSYSGKGDDGSTSLGGGQRVDKDDLRVESYGTVDELNSLLGLCMSFPMDELSADNLRKIQNELFHVGCDLCILEKDKEKFSVPQIHEKHVAEMEHVIETIEKKLNPLQNFVLPGGTSAAASLHVSRSVCRRAERIVVALSKKEKINPLIIKYLNRLSSLLFCMGRLENQRNNVIEHCWNSKA